MRNKLSYLFIATAGICWGLTGACNRFMTAQGFSQNQIMFVRTAVAFILMVLYLCFKDRAAFRIKLKDIWLFLGSGIASLALFGISYFHAMQMMSLSAAAVLLYMAPVFVVLMSAIFFKEHISLQKIIALILIVAGAALTTGFVGGGAVKITPTGLMFGFLSAIGYAFYSIFSKAALQRGYSANTITLYTFAFCTISVGIIAGVPQTIQLAISSSNSIFWSICIGVVTCLLPYMFYTRGLQGVENGIASIIASVELIVATLVSVFFFHETFLFVNLIGIILVFAGIICVNVKFDMRRGNNG